MELQLEDLEAAATEDELARATRASPGRQYVSAPDPIRAAVPPFVRCASHSCISAKLVNQLLLLQRTNRQYRLLRRRYCA
jgi:hypothetical protein